MLCILSSVILFSSWTAASCQHHTTYATCFNPKRSGKRTFKRLLNPENKRDFFDFLLRMNFSCRLCVWCLNHSKHVTVSNVMNQLWDEKMKDDVTFKRTRSVFFLLFFFFCASIIITLLSWTLLSLRLFASVWFPSETHTLHFTQTHSHPLRKVRWIKPWYEASDFNSVILNSSLHLHRLRKVWYASYCSTVDKLSEGFRVTCFLQGPLAD